MGKSCAIHVNPNLRHQVDYGAAMKAGLIKHGIKAFVTPAKRESADLHVVIGPWWAFIANIGENVLYLDRAFWGDPGAVSVTWLDFEGNRIFNWDRRAEDRWHPELQEQKHGPRTVFLADYGDMEPNQGDYTTVRRHPSESPQAQTLEECLNAHENAVGAHTTALVSAAIHGLNVRTTSSSSPCAGLRYLSREDWIQCLAWHNWGLSEIESGEAWERLGDYS